ncbi:MAG: DUF2357 domain-containing protein, partial [Acholeplasmataceae bacterium]|nr:DUF2357 domain-containing protein [Acholeplasmataceae bacterium]
MKKVSDLNQFHELLIDALYQIEKEEEFPNHFYQAFLSGENKIYQKSISETKTFDEEWIQTIESYFPSLDKISKDPKSGLRYDQEVTAIEKAKKTNSDSIKHLAANTHLIKEVRPDMVVPKRILVTQAEIEYGIYENRFIKTLIERLFKFVNDRYSIVKDNIDAYENKHFNLSSNFNIRTTEVNMEIDIKLKEELDSDSVSSYNHELLGRITSLLKKVNGLKISPFMESVKKAKPVVPPIMKTSIILKNVDYKNAYLLWLFLDKYNTLAYDIDVKEQNLSFDKYYLKNIYQTALIAFSTIIANQKSLEDHYQYLDISEYKRKSPKFIKKSLKDLLENPEPFEMENNQINQYYLEQNRNIFKKNLDGYMKDSSSYEVSLRKALRDTIQITNALYQDYFGFEDETDTVDVFKRMVKEDTESLLETAKEKAKIARIIRETKEIDYNNAIRLEKKMMKEIEQVNRILAKEAKKKIKEKARRTFVEEKLKIERDNAIKNQEILREYLDYVNEQKKIIQDEHNDISQLIKDEAKRLKEDERIRILEEKQRARDLYEKELEK